MILSIVLGVLLPLIRRAPSHDNVGDASSDLVKRAVQGDRRSFDDLYRLHVDGAHRLLTRIVGPVSEREDLIQQVFLEAFRGLAGFRGDAAFSTWIHRIVVHVAYRHLRKQRRLRWEEIPEGLAPSLEAARTAMGRRQCEFTPAMEQLLRTVYGLTADERAKAIARGMERLRPKG